jgi:di/tricarboxylate transporter
MWSTYFPEQGPITFSSWMSFALPMALVLFAALWATLCLMYCSKNTGRALSAYLDRTHLRRELSLLGMFSFFLPLCTWDSRKICNIHLCFDDLASLNFERTLG